MGELVVDGLGRGSVVPEDYIFPAEQRANAVSTCESIPVIDLQGGSEEEVSKEVLKAGKEFGFFQVINHGVPQEVIDDVMRVGQEFFEMAAEDKAYYYSEDPMKEPRIFTGQGYGKEESRYWRDCFIMPAFPVQTYLHQFPEKPPHFKDVISKFAPEVNVLAKRLLKLISMGLGLEEDYLTGDLSGGPIKMVFNYYPPCPDPSLTLGLPKHCDPNLITLLLQGTVRGLQVIHDGRWIPVDPLPNAFTVNFGLLFEVVTNGLLKAVEHRAVTNGNVARMSIALPIRSTADCVICPAEPLVSAEHKPPIYGSFTFPEFFKIFSTKKTDDKDTMMEDFKMKK